MTLDDTHAVGGFLTPGDMVNVLVTVDIKDATSKNAEAVKTTAFLIPGLKVLGVGSTTGAASTSSNSSTSSSKSNTGSSSDSNSNSTSSSGSTAAEIRARS